MTFGLVIGPWIGGSAYAQANAARVQITASIDDGDLVRLAGNTRSEANAHNDRGRVPDGLVLSHIQLLLKRPTERAAALRSDNESLHDPASPNFHRWLNVDAFRRRYGLAQADLDTISGWLKQRGFTVNAQYPSSMIIDFSGTAGMVLGAFHTEIHQLEVSGKSHIANMSDPLIPSALAPAIVGLISLNDFRPHPNFRSRAGRVPGYTVGSNTLLAPADIATIYNFNPLFAEGISGQGQKIVVVEDSDLYNYSANAGSPDWNSFRSTFGLSASYPQGSLTQEHPALPTGGGATCLDPGVVNGDEFEAELDAEWASAAAPSAAIVVASCANTTTDGVLIASENLVNATSPPAIMSISYGNCEAENTATTNLAYYEIFSQAVNEGISVFVAAGDEGAAACDADENIATHGIGVNGLASTPYDVAVGGTDFGDRYAGSAGSYWSSTNSATYGSALSYVPEIPWNDSCASALLATYDGASVAYGSGGFCNIAPGNTAYQTTASGSGGPSGCATGRPSNGENGVVSGTCKGVAKPSWQSSLLGNPSDGVRDLPDVSLFAGNGLWGHYYVVCDSDTGDTTNSGHACTGAPSGWSGGGGTSFATPIMAGIQALVNQASGSRQGNPNPIYYALASAEYGALGNGNCNSSAGRGAASDCVFYDVTLGDMDVDCTGTNECYLPAGKVGALSTSNTMFATAYGTTTGWDFATGIGTVNVENLVNGWNSSDLTLSGGGTVTATAQLSYTFTIGNAGPRSAGTVVLSTTLPGGFSFVSGSSSPGCAVTNQVVACTLTSLAVGGAASLTIVVQPGNAQTANLTFTVTSANGVLFAPNDTVATSVALTGNSGDGGTSSDAPLPLWAVGALGAGLVAAARQRLRRAHSAP